MQQRCSCSGLSAGVARRQRNGPEVGTNAKQISPSYQRAAPVPKRCNPLSSQHIKGNQAQEEEREALVQMIMTCSFVSCAHELNLKHYILTASFCVSYHFSVTSTFGVLIAIDLHSSPFSHTRWGGEYFPTLSQWHTDWSWVFQGAGKSSKHQPEGRAEFFVTCLKMSRNLSAVLVH